MKVEDQIKELIESKITELGYILDEVTYTKENKTNFLRIVIDKQGAVDVEDCVIVSRAINPILDEADLIADSYMLDVCSKEKGENYDGQ